MNQPSWETEFRRIFTEALERYHHGQNSVTDCLTDEDVAILSTMGCRRQEMYDFIDDLARYGEPSLETALALARLRYDYFHGVQKGKWEEDLPSSTLPPKTEEVDGMVWLPRIMEKARRKLRGQMNDDLMYGCAGDRAFLKKSGISAEDFLQATLEAGENRQKVIDFVKHSIQKHTHGS